MISLLDTVKPKEAQGLVNDVYSGFSNALGKLPNVIQFHTASPDIYGYLMGVLNEFSTHQSINPVLQAYLRVIISHREGGEYCVKFQSYLLRMHGILQEDIDLAVEDPKNVKLEEKQKQLLLFALQLIAGGTEPVTEDLNKLRDLGWTDKDIYEICFLGGLQKGMTPLINGFKVQHDF